jgi:hypothetical protein
VHRKRKTLLIGLASALGFLILVYAGANVFLQFEGVQNRIRQATAASLGVPVEIGGVGLTPWSGLTLRDLVAENPEKPGENLFEAKSLNVRLAWGPLLQRQVVITSITLRDPIALIPPGGQIVLMPPTERVEVALPEDATDDVVVEAPPEDRLPPPDEEEILPPKRPTFTIEVQKFRIENGLLVLRSGAGQPSLVVSGLTVETKIGQDQVVEGKISIREAVLDNSLFLRDIGSSFQRKGGVLEFPDIQALLAGGLLQGRLALEEQGGAFASQLELTDIQLPVLLQEAGVPSQRTAGKLFGQMELAGAGPVETLLGAGEFALLEGRLEPLDFMRQVGTLLRIEELQLLELAEARARVRLAAGELLVEDVHLQSENLIIRSKGTVQLDDGALDLQSRILINESLQRSLGGLISRFLEASDTEGYRQLPFRVYGTTARPRTDLLDRVGAGRLGSEVGRFLQNILGAPAPQPSED